MPYFFRPILGKFSLSFFPIYIIIIYTIGGKNDQAGIV